MQAQLAANAQRRARGTNGKSPHLLTGLLYDADGKRIAPHHCNKRGRRYHYYVTRDPDARSGWRLPASMIETAVIDGIGVFLRDGRRMIDALGATAQDVQSLLERADHLAREIQSCDPAAQRAMLCGLIWRVQVTKEQLRLALCADTLRARLGIAAPAADTGAKPSTLHLDLPVAFRRRGVETKLVIGGATSGTAPDRALVEAVLSAHRWFAELTSGDARSIRDLAARHGVDKGDISRILPLAFLAPDIVAAILDGKQPVELTAYRLKRLHQLPLLWSDQRRVLGFA